MPRKNSQIRIISGKLGGRLIDTPKTDKTHPMGDRERSAIFNRLRGEIADKVILDAFAGSGAIGLEALSLGAAEVDFLENNRKAAKTIHGNIAKFKLEDKAKLVRKIRDEYDIIFADPPYEAGMERSLLGVLSKMSYVNEDTIIIIEALIDTDFSFASEYGFDILKPKRTNKYKSIRYL
jgi:16S rRNA (guanine966-N2)-methyltransferase